MATVDLVIPCYNEEHVLAGSVERVLAFADAHPEHQWRVVVANNASTDGTLEVARGLEGRFPGRVAALDIPVKGRGIALRTAWLTTEADVMAYMDVDLSTDLAHLPALVDPIAAGEVDLAYGTRLHRDSQTTRSAKREFISRSYVFILNRVAGLRVTDAQCGFKAISRRRPGRWCPWCETRSGSSTRNCCGSPRLTATGCARCPSAGWKTRTRA